MCRHRNDRQVLSASCFAGPNCSRRVKTIHDRHLNVHQQNIELLLHRHFECFSTILNCCDMMPVFFEHTYSKSLIDNIVFGKQNFEFPQFRVFSGLDLGYEIFWLSNTETPHD